MEDVCVSRRRNPEGRAVEVRCGAVQGRGWEEFAERKNQVTHQAVGGDRLGGGERRLRHQRDGGERQRGARALAVVPAGCRAGGPHRGWSWVRAWLPSRHALVRRRRGTRYTSAATGSGAALSSRMQRETPACFGENMRVYVHLRLAKL